ncbi:MAG: hypothetical protein JRH18_17220 [Deltaproteobacteria bacterium]|nr:hypothetical protein [Deltaproteobacteria bacterium]MBW2153398.1 hypothetical protein [Deltaproteobacteria bacterium]
MLRLRYRFVFVVFILIFFACQSVYAFNIYRVGGEITGQEYNDAWKRWFDRKFSIWVGVDEDNTEYIFFKGETGLGDATVMVQYSEMIKRKLKKAITKAIEWSDVARKNKADASKSLGCFGRDKYGLCEKEGTAFDENQMGLSFFAANNGEQTNLIISLVDRDNQFIKTSIYIDLPEMKKLLNTVDKIESVLKKAHKTARDQKLFK